MKEILIIGGGFAGINAALCAASEIDGTNSGVHITVVSKDEYLTLRPRLYEKNPETLRTPFRSILDEVGVSFIEGVVQNIDTVGRSVAIETTKNGGKSHFYDKLIIAMGSELKELPVSGITENTWNIDNYDAAVALDQHLGEMARAPDTPARNTFVIVGSGLTGIELATEIRGRIEACSDKDVADKARIVLVEQSDTIGPGLGSHARPIIEATLHDENIETRLSTQIVNVRTSGIELSDGERLETATVIVTAGIRANPIARSLGVECDELGRLPVDEMLRIEGIPDAFAVGDMARAYVDEDNLALMSCQHAMPMGKFAGYNAARELLGLPLRPYSQPNYVTCFDLGAAGGVFTVGWDRQVEMTGDDAKQLKRKINEEWIYPPQGDRTTILAASHIDAERSE